MKKSMHVRRKICIDCGQRFTSYYNRTVYCPNCSVLEHRMHTEGFSPKVCEAIRRYVRKEGWHCCYSGVTFDLDDDASPWYYNFDHYVPKNPARIVLACALVNVMKNDLSFKEFRYYVLALDDHRRKHLKVRKRKLRYWERLAPGGPRLCPKCGGHITGARKRFCQHCLRIAVRLNRNNHSAQAKAAVWAYIRNYGYVCHYTGMKLEFDVNSPWYCSFVYCSPRDRNTMVLTSRMVSAMKSDLTEHEFWAVIHQLAGHFRKGTPVRKIRLAYWKRPYRRL